MRYTLAVIIVGATLACQANRFPSTPPATAQAGAPEDSASAIRSDNRRTVQEVMQSIAGQESQPAGQVFTDVQYLKDVSAANLLDIMSIGYANALGVRCSHCHDTRDFSSDAKRPKRAAREMQTMHRSINTQLIAMQHLETQPPGKRTINCNLCHQGRINPNKP